MKNTIWNYPFLILGLILVLTNSCTRNKSIPETVTDIDGNVYNTITIGTQVWMAENLKTTRYRNGATIPNITDNVTWGDLTRGAYCDYDNNEYNSITYGRLYNWYAVNDSRKLAPKGWHIPTDAEWTTLINYLGGDSIAECKLKEKGSIHWYRTKGATNESHFTALPCGERSLYGEFYGIRGGGNWWSYTEYSKDAAWYRGITSNTGKIWRERFGKSGGMAIRCLMD